MPELAMLDLEPGPACRLNNAHSLCLAVATPTPAPAHLSMLETRVPCDLGAGPGSSFPDGPQESDPNPNP